MKHILIADDEASIRQFIKRSLELKGYHVDDVADGGQAMEALSHKNYDLLLTDIVMPVMDGIALALKASADHPDLPILLMTGYASELQRARNIESLLQNVISKPFTMDEICDHVDHALSALPMTH